MIKNLKLIEHIHHLMDNQRIILTYLGEITPEIINAILKVLKKENKGFETELSLKKKVYKIIVECLENITKHSEVVSQEAPTSIFLLGKKDNNFFVITGNYINARQVNEIKSAIDRVNSMEKDAIQQKYREVLLEGIISPKGGAGLGLLDIAIKSGRKLEYEFLDTDDSSTFYILKTQVTSN